MNWQPISTAPTDGTRILLYYPPMKFGRQPRTVCGKWEREEAARNPKPHWIYDNMTFGVRDARENPPTHWCPLPPPPESTK
jgi:hypothetical protein